MTDVGTALRELAEPWAGGERIKVVIGRAARRAGLTYWRAYDLWYGRGQVQTFELDAIGNALAKKREEAARNEIHELRTRLARLESLMAQADSDFFRPSLAAVGEQIRQVGGKSRNPDSSVD